MQTTRPEQTMRSAAATRLLAGLSTLMLAAALPAAAHGQTLNPNVRLAEPVTLAQPALRLANPTVSARPLTVQPTLPTIDTGRLAPNALTPETAIVTRPQLGAATAAAAGLGRLVAPGSAESSVVVARIGSAARAEVPTLTADFDGDGLINFEIAPGIVELAPAGADRDIVGGLVGQHVSMATGTADRVLDGVINVEGVVRATTFAVSEGTVVLGGFDPSGPTGPTDDTGRIPDPGRGDDHAGTGNTGKDNDPTIPGCLTRICDREDPLPGPGNGPGTEAPFNFSGHLRPMPTHSDFQNEPGDLIDVSIMLPLRGRERESDQFSNHGNEEIW